MLQKKKRIRDKKIRDRDRKLFILLFGGRY